MVRVNRNRVSYAEARLALSAPLVKRAVGDLWTWWENTPDGEDKCSELREKLSEIMPPAWTGWFVLDNDLYEWMFYRGVSVESTLDLYLSSYAALQCRYARVQERTHSVGYVHVHMTDVVGLSSPETIAVDSTPSVMYERMQGFHA